jgi:hypothetical protein
MPGARGSSRKVWINNGKTARGVARSGQDRLKQPPPRQHLRVDYASLRIDVRLTEQRGLTFTGKTLIYNYIKEHFSLEENRRCFR